MMTMMIIQGSVGKESRKGKGRSGEEAGGWNNSERERESGGGVGVEERKGWRLERRGGPKVAVQRSKGDKSPMAVRTPLSERIPAFYCYSCTVGYWVARIAP